MTVSAVLLAWTRGVGSGDLDAVQFWEFFRLFMGRLRWQVMQMKNFDVASAERRVQAAKQ